MLFVMLGTELSACQGTNSTNTKPFRSPDCMSYRWLNVFLLCDDSDVFMY